VGEFMPGKLVQAEGMPNRKTTQQEKKKCLFF
jgi:hypothetical protein